MMIDEDLKERIRRLNPIEEVVNESIPLKNNQGRCPSHTDKSPSFTVNPKLQIAKCWAGCTGGHPFSNRDGSLDVFGFYQWYFDCTFPQALERLAKRAGIALEESHRKSYKKDPYKEIKDFLIKHDMLYRRWKRYMLKEIDSMHASLSQKLRKRVHEQYQKGVITQYALQRRLLGLEIMDEEFESIK